MGYHQLKESPGICWCDFG